MTRKLLFFMCVSILCIYLFPFHSSEAAESARMAQIMDVEGDVKVRKAGGSKTFTAYESMHLNEGDHISTGKDASVVLQVLDREDEVTIGENARLYISELREVENPGESDGSSSSFIKKTSLTIWKGFMWIKAMPLFNDDDEFEVETPTAVMGVRGTQFFTTVDPRTGRTTIHVGAGFVQANQRGNSSNNPDPRNFIYPTQQMDVYEPTEGEEASVKGYISIEEFTNNVHMSIIEAILRNKEALDEENEEYIRRQRQLIEQGSSNLPDELVEGDENLELHQQNLILLANLLINQSLQQGHISEQEVLQFLEQANNENYDPNVDGNLGLTESQRRQQEALEESRRQQEQKQREQEEQKQREQEKFEQLLEQIRQQQQQLQQQNEQKAKEKQNEAVERYKESLTEEEREAFESRQQSLNNGPQPPGNPSGPPAPPQRPNNPGSPSAPPAPPTMPPSNAIPEAKPGLDKTLREANGILLRPSDVATDANGDALSFASMAQSSDENIVMASITNGRLFLKPQSNGTATIRVAVSDGDDTTVISFQVRVTLNANPVAVISQDPTTITNKSTVVWSYNDSYDPDGDAIVNAEWRGDYGKKYEAGTHTVRLRVQDAIGNWSDWTEKTFKVSDVIAPGVVTNLSKTATESSVTLTWHNPTDADFDKVEIYRGSVLVGSTLDERFTEDELEPNSTLTYALYAVDKAGNRSPKVEYTIQTLEPNHPPEAEPEMDVLIEGDEVEVLSAEAIAADPDEDVLKFVGDPSTSNSDVVTAKIDGNLLYLDPQANGEATITVQVTDEEVTTEITFVVTVEMPVAVITNLPESITNKSWVEWYYDESYHPREKTIVDAEWDGDHQMTYLTGTYTIQLRVKDESGHWSKWVEKTFEVADVIAPGVVTNLGESSSTDTSVTLKWQNPTDADFDKVEIYRDSVLVGTASDEQFTESELEPSSTFTYALYAVDKSGNRSDKVEYTVQTLEPNHPPETEPEMYVIIEGYEVEVLSAEAIAADADEDLLSFVGDASTSNSDVVTAKIDGDLLYLDPQANGEATITVQVTDGEATTEISFLVIVEMPVAVITQIPESATNESVVEWDYGESYHPYEQTIVDAEWGGDYQNHYQAGTYTVRLRVKAESGHWSKWVEKTFEVADVLAPDEVSSVSVIRSDTRITFSWGNPHDSDFDHVNIYRDEVLIGTSTTERYVDEGLTPETSYDYELKTVDANGNESGGIFKTVTTKTIDVLKGIEPTELQNITIPYSIGAATDGDDSTGFTSTSDFDNDGSFTFELAEPTLIESLRIHIDDYESIESVKVVNDDSVVSGTIHLDGNNQSYDVYSYNVTQIIFYQKLNTSVKLYTIEGYEGDIYTE